MRSCRAENHLARAPSASRPDEPVKAVRLAPSLLTVALASAACGGDLPDDKRAESAEDEQRFGGTPVQSQVALEFLIEDGIDLYYRGQIDSARATLLSISGLASQAADTAAWAKALTWLGLAAWRQGDYPEARRLGRQALDLKLAANLSDQLYRSYNALGLTAWHEARLTEAGEMFGEALAAARAVGDERGMAGASGNLGLVQMDLGEFPKARQNLMTLRDAGRALGSALHEANGLTNLGVLDILEGAPRAAIPRLEEARRLYRSEQLGNEEVAVRQLGDAYAALGDLGRAHAIYDTALAMARAQGDRQREAANLEGLAALYGEAGDHLKALEFYSTAREINHELGLLLETGTDLLGASLTYHALGDLELAEENAARAMEIHREIGAPIEELQDVLILAELAYLGERLSDMDRWMNRARELGRDLDARAPRLAIALTEARIADAAGVPEQVLAALSPIQADLGQGDYAAEWETEALRARAHLRRGDLTSAAEAGRRAVSMVERVRRNLASGVLRTSFTAARIQTYSDLVTVLLRLGRTAEAFEVADAVRARALLEHLAAADPKNLPFDTTAVQLAESQRLLRQIDQLVAALDSVQLGVLGSDEQGRATEARDRLSRLDRVRGEYEALLVSLAEGAGSAEALLGATWTSASSVQGVLQPTEVLLEYMVTPDRLVIFIVTDEDIRIAESAIGSDDLATRVRLAREVLRANVLSESEGIRVLEALHRLLIEPAVRAAAISNRHRLLFVPHDVLTYLPFAALRDATTGRYVAEDFALLHLPSAAAVTALRSLDRRRARVDDGRLRLQVLAPFPEQLPGTRREAEAIRALLAGSQTRIGSQATEGHAREALAQGGVVHLATHGVMNPRNPMFSRLELRQGVEGRSADDGRLEVHELLGLAIEAPLVFLSGCETGLGGAWSSRFVRGEDFATLARAFLYAGSDNVVATLWSLEDESAAVFAELFYRELERESPVEALARARRAMIADDRYASPYSWAAYRLSGSGG